MFISSVFCLLALVHVSLAAVTCNSPGGDQASFGSCTYNNLGAMGARSPEEACAGNTGNSYNMCMCSSSSSVIRCYNNHCAGDPGVSNQIRNQANYCNIQATSTVNSLTTVAMTSALVTMSTLTETLTTASMLSFLTMPTATYSYPLSTAAASPSLGANIGLPAFPKSDSSTTTVTLCTLFGLNLMALMFI